MRLGNLRIVNFTGSSTFFNTTIAYIPAGDRPALEAYTTVYILTGTDWGISGLTVYPNGTLATGTPGKNPNSSARIRGTAFWCVA